MATSSNSPTAGETADQSSGNPGNTTAPDPKAPDTSSGKDKGKGFKDPEPTTTETEPTEVEAEGTHVKYTGPSIHTRILSAHDFKSGGVENQKQVVWDASNDHKVAIEDLSSEAVDFILNQPNKEFVRV